MILFNVRLLSELPLAVELAARLTARGESLAFCSETAAPDTDGRIRAAAERLGAGYFNMEALAAEPPGERWWQRTASGLSSALAAVTRTPEDQALEDSPKGKAFIAQFAGELRAASSILEDSRADLLVVFQDGVSANHALIKSARSRGVPILDCPYGFGTSRDFDDYLEEKVAEDNLPLPEGAFGERVRRDHPKWIRKLGGRDVMMFPPEYVLVREKLGLSLPLPWVIHGGLSDVLAAESEEMRQHYLREGIEAAKVQLTGTVYCDAIYDRLQASTALSVAYANASKIHPGRTTVLVSLPPSQHTTRGSKNEFVTYEDALRAIATMVHQADAEGVVSIHPTTLPKDREFIASLGLPVTDEWVVPLIPAFDLFFTTFSSTIRWAIACGKPVLNYNMYGYRCHDYDEVEGVMTYSRLADISAQLMLHTDDGHFARSAARQKEAGRRWGMLDGGNFDRIHAVIGELKSAAPRMKGRR